MSSLLSREEVSALLHEAEDSLRTPPRQLVIDVGQQYIVLRSTSNLEGYSLLELDISLSKPYLLRSKDNDIAIGMLIVADGKLFFKITQRVNCNNCSVME